ncbi:MAG: hypothetical protein AAFR31_20295 [Cyanobacteria bacterium J06627_8]
MTQVCMNTGILEELDQLSSQSLPRALHTADDDFWGCFGFIPVETYEEVCCAVKREEIKADAFKDVLVELFQCINYFAENVDSASNAEVLQHKYADAMNAAHVRFEQLEDDLNTNQSVPTYSYSY